MVARCFPKLKVKLYLQKPPFYRLSPTFISHAMTSKNEGDRPNTAGKQNDPESGNDQLKLNGLYPTSSKSEEQISAPSSNSRPPAHTAEELTSSFSDPENKENEEPERHDREGAPSPEPLPHPMRNNLVS
jgi:hypothetical protein